MRCPGLLRNLVALIGSGLILLQPARGENSPLPHRGRGQGEGATGNGRFHKEVTTNRFSFNDYLLAPIRVHLLASKDSPTIQTTLTDKDITRILGKMNGVWRQAGLHFYLESLVREEANVQEVSPQAEGQSSR